MKVILREVRYDWEDEEALNHCDVGADMNFELVADDTYTFGHIYISKDTETADGTPCPVYINWVEFLSIFQYKHLLRNTLNAVYDMFGEFYLEANEENAEKYRHLGAVSQGFDEITELEKFKYKKAA